MRRVYRRGCDPMRSEVAQLVVRSEEDAPEAQMTGVLRG